MSLASRRLLLAYLIVPIVGTVLLLSVPMLWIDDGTSDIGPLRVVAFWSPVVLPVMYAVEWAVVKVLRTTRFPPETIPVPRALVVSGVVGALAVAATFGMLLDDPLHPGVLGAGAACGVVMGAVFCAIRGRTLVPDGAT